MRPELSYQRGHWAILLACVVALALAACGKGAAPSFKSTDITGSGIGGNFTLADPSGKARSLDEFRGKVVVVFFGYTQCPDVCPTTLADAAAALKDLGPQAGEVQVLFITVDPERDTAELLANYVPAFHPTFIGLRGSAEELQRVAKLFKVIYARSNTPGGSTRWTIRRASSCSTRRGGYACWSATRPGPSLLAHDIRQLLR